MYHLQLETNDFGLQLSTEIVAETIEELQFEANKKIKSNPECSGMKYNIFQSQDFFSGNNKLVKSGIVS